MKWMSLPEMLAEKGDEVVARRLSRTAEFHIDQVLAGGHPIR
jgi:hypothetical protein